MGKKSTLTLALISLLFCACLAEIFMRSTDLSLQFLRQSLFYSNFDFAAHQESENVYLLYSLRPGIEMVSRGSVHPLEASNYLRKVKTNRHGFRSPDWDTKKPAGVFRIFIFGGSNTYGASVSDSDTYPQKLQNLLDKKAPGKYQVWNGGLTASVLSQGVELARYAVKNLEPDLILFQDFVNFGRRAFLIPGAEVPKLNQTKISHFFRSNPELWAENIPLFFFSHPKIIKIHRWLAMHFELYRIIPILLNNKIVKLNFPHHHSWDCHLREEDCNTISKTYSAFGEQVNEREFQKFLGENPKMPVLLFDPVGGGFCDGKEHLARGVLAFSNCFAGKAPEFKEVHPPAYVYDGYVKTIFSYLERNNLIPYK